MKVTMNGDSVTYYADKGQHVVIYQLAPGEVVSVESEIFLPLHRTVIIRCASSAVEFSLKKDLPHQP